MQDTFAQREKEASQSQNAGTNMRVEIIVWDAVCDVSDCRPRTTRCAGRPQACASPHPVCHARAWPAAYNSLQACS